MKPTPQTQKSLAVASLLGATLKSAMNGDFKLNNLNVQCNRAMQVYAKMNRKDYYKVCDDTFEIWKLLAKQHNNTLDEDEVALFTEMLCSLIPRKDFKTFFNINPYTTTEKIRDSRKSGILMSLMTLDASLNEMFGTVPTVNRESLGLILSKPIKPKSVKMVLRDKAKPKVLKMIKNRAKWNRKRIAVTA